jgi:hypothetical protein
MRPSDTKVVSGAAAGVLGAVDERADVDETDGEGEFKRWFFLYE